MRCVRTPVDRDGRGHENDSASGGGGGRERI